jgi:tripartite-type tricarboxylate transporter receptor subunit TctC
MDMPVSRRAVVAALGALPFANVLLANTSRAESGFPAKPIRIIVGYPPGQTVDNTARTFAVGLSQIARQPVFVENKPGANGIIGVQEVKRAAPDGYTLLFGTSGQLAINPALYKTLPYDPLKDLEPVALLTTGPLFLAVPQASPFKTLGELVAAARQNPGKFSYGSGGRGITAHLAMEMLKKEAGIDLLHVPFKGSAPALAALLGQQVDAMMDAGGLMTPQIEQGKVRALGVSSKARVANLPDVPTIAEQGYPGFEVASWSAAVAPVGTPAPVVDALNAALMQAQKHPDVVRAFQLLGSNVDVSSVAGFRAFLASETVKWSRAAKDAGIEPE